MTEHDGEVFVLMVEHSRVVGAEAHSITTSLDLFQGAGHDGAILVNLHNNADVSKTSVVSYSVPSSQHRNTSKQKKA